MIDQVGDRHETLVGRFDRISLGTSHCCKSLGLAVEQIVLTLDGVVMKIDLPAEGVVLQVQVGTFTSQRLSVEQVGSQCLCHLPFYNVFDEVEDLLGNFRRNASRR